MATLTINSPATERIESVDTAQDPTVVTPAETSPKTRKSIGQILWIGVPLIMVAVCAVTIIAFVIGGVPLGEAIGYGTYLAVWIGGGFGVILSGAYYNHVNDGMEGQ